MPIYLFFSVNLLTSLVLDAFAHLSMRVCSSVRPPVRMSVCPCNNIKEKPPKTAENDDLSSESFGVAYFAVIVTVKPRYSTPPHNESPSIKHINFVSKKCFHSYLYVGNRKNLGLQHNFDHSLEIPYGGV